MNTRRVIDQGGGKVRVEKCNEPALETANSRIVQIGQFRVDSLAASQTGVAEKYQGIDANAQTSFIAGRAGHIMGVAWTRSTAVTAGTLTVQATVGGTGSGDAISLAAAATGVAMETTPVPFAAGAALGVKHTTNSGFTPTPHVAVDLLVRWSAAEPATPEVL